jgi:hypothetical protein
MLTMFPNDCMCMYKLYEKKVIALVNLKTTFPPIGSYKTAFYRLVVEISPSNQLVQEPYMHRLVRNTTIILVSSRVLHMTPWPRNTSIRKYSEGAPYECRIIFQMDNNGRTSRAIPDNKHNTYKLCNKSCSPINSLFSCSRRYIVLGRSVCEIIVNGEQCNSSTVQYSPITHRTGVLYVWTRMSVCILISGISKTYCPTFAEAILFVNCYVAIFLTFVLYLTIQVCVLFSLMCLNLYCYMCLNVLYEYMYKLYA